MQWTSRTEQQAADMINRAHLQYRLNDHRPQYNEGLRQVPRYHQPQPQPMPYYTGPVDRSNWEPLRPRDVLLYGSWLAVIIGFIGGALFGLLA